LAELDVTKNSNRLLTDVLGDSSPTFSLNGQYLLTVLSNNGGGSGQDIYRLNGDGNGRIRLTQTPLFVTADPDVTKNWNNVAPTWSPDGQLIAFLTDRNGSWELWVMNSDGSDQRPMFSAEVMSQLNIQYNFVDEHVVSWH
jgi:TolB protein